MPQVTDVTSNFSTIAVSRKKQGLVSSAQDFETNYKTTNCPMSFPLPSGGFFNASKTAPRSSRTCRRQIYFLSDVQHVTNESLLYTVISSYRVQNLTNQLFCIPYSRNSLVLDVKGDTILDSWPLWVHGQFRLHHILYVPKVFVLKRKSITSFTACSKSTSKCREITFHQEAVFYPPHLHKFSAKDPNLSQFAQDLGLRMLTADPL